MTKVIVSWKRLCYHQGRIIVGRVRRKSYMRIVVVVVVVGECWGIVISMCSINSSSSNDSMLTIIISTLRTITSLTTTIGWNQANILSI